MCLKNYNCTFHLEFLFDLLHEYIVSDERKEDQVAVAKQLLDVIKKSEDKKLLLAYLNASFSLKNHQYPHKMVF